jgi:hypothetical protein
VGLPLCLGLGVVEFFQDVTAKSLIKTCTAK